MPGIEIGIGFDISISDYFSKGAPTYTGAKHSGATVL